MDYYSKSSGALLGETFGKRSSETILAEPLEGTKVADQKAPRKELTLNSAKPKVQLKLLPLIREQSVFKLS